MARWKRRLNCSFFSLRTSLSWSSVIPSGRRSRLHLRPPSGDALRMKRVFDRQFGGRRASGALAREVFRHAVDLEHDAAGRHAAAQNSTELLPLPMRTSVGFRNRHVREDADPDAAGALHVTGDGARRAALDLTRVTRSGPSP